MAIDSFKVRADALRAEAKSARADVSERYQSRMTDIDTESARVRRDTRIAEQAAKQATEDAKDFATGARVDYTSAAELEQSAAEAAKRGDTKQAEEETELAVHVRGSAARYERQEREATLEAAKYREEAAGHDLRAKELRYEIRDTNGLNNAAEKQLDNLEERARLYEEANRKFDEADGPVNAPKRAQLQREADAAIAQADAIEVDRAAIRALAPDFPGQTPGVDAGVSSVMTSDDDNDPTALAFAGSDDADPDANIEPGADLGLDQDDPAQTAPDSQAPERQPSLAAASADDGTAAVEMGDVEEFTFETPEPVSADAGAQDTTFGSTDTLAEQDFTGNEAPVDSFVADTDSSFPDTDFA